MMVVWRSG